MKGENIPTKIPFAFSAESGIMKNVELGAKFVPINRPLNITNKRVVNTHAYFRVGIFSNNPLHLIPERTELFFVISGFVEEVKSLRTEIEGNQLTDNLFACVFGFSFVDEFFERVEIEFILIGTKPPIEFAHLEQASFIECFTGRLVSKIFSATRRVD